jgi:hypothetical protein
MSIDWNTLPLGRLPDAEIARRLGVSRQWVARHRVARGIPPCATGERRAVGALTPMELEDIAALEAAIAKLLDAAQPTLSVAVATSVCRTPGWEVEARRSLRARALPTGFRIRAPGRRGHTAWLSPEAARTWLLEAGWVDAAAAHIEALKDRDRTTGEKADAAA